MVFFGIYGSWDFKKKNTNANIVYSVMCVLVSWASSSKMLDIYKKTFSVSFVSGEYINNYYEINPTTCERLPTYYLVLSKVIQNSAIIKTANNYHILLSIGCISI